MNLAPAPHDPSDATHQALRDQVGALEVALLQEQQRSAALQQERDRLRSAYEQLKQELELLKRRLFVVSMPPSPGSCAEHLAKVWSRQEVMGV